jgi:hypothetical protein
LQFRPTKDSRWDISRYVHGIMEYLPKYFQKLTAFHTYLMKGFQRKWLFEGSPNKGKNAMLIN